MQRIFDAYAGTPDSTTLCSSGVWCGCSVDCMEDIPPNQRLVFAYDRVYCCVAHAGRHNSAMCVVHVHERSSGFHFTVAHGAPMSHVYDVVHTHLSSYANTPFHLSRHADTSSTTVVSDIHFTLRYKRPISEEFIPALQ